MHFSDTSKILDFRTHSLTLYRIEFILMRTIVFATHKGGCGKTTLATSLAVAAREAGESVVVFDLDPKNCASRWGSIRMDRMLPVRALEYGRLSRALNSAAKRNVSLVIIDTPALESQATLAALKAADLTIVPARPSQFDTWAAEVTGRMMNLRKEKFVFLLNQSPHQRHTRRMRAVIAALAAAGSLLAPQIGMSQRFLEAAAKGKGVTEIDRNGPAAREMRSLWLAIKRST
jgi:chromosome partitioning protein